MCLEIQTTRVLAAYIIWTPTIASPRGIFRGDESSAPEK